ncbi:MAG: magnesium transporter, partial [Chloroflexi bacterium]|nr:magnesium transporter [Chloroflexota bacterium]
LLVGVLAYAWKGNVALGVVAGLAMLLNLATAVTVGVLVPVTLKALRLDPALASGVLVTTFTDVLGFFFFLGIATLMIERIA